MVRARVGTWVLVALLALPLAAGAPWLESRHDATRSGATTDLGPRFNETAFTVHLDGPRGFAATPVILDGFAYVLTQNLRHFSSFGYNETGRDAVWRIDLDTGAAEVVFDVPTTGFWGEWPAMASDGRFVYVVSGGQVNAYDTVMGGPADTIWTHAPLLATAADDRWGWVCNPPTIVLSTLYLGCIEIAGDVDASTGRNTLSGFISVAGAVPLDAATGHSWWRPVPPTRPYDTDNPGAGNTPDACTVGAGVGSDVTQTSCPSPPLMLGHTVLDGRFFAVVSTGAIPDVIGPGVTGPTNEAVIVEPALVAFDATDGTILWARHHPPEEQGAQVADDATEPEYRPHDRVVKIEVTGAGGFVFSREPELVWLAPADGDRLFGPIQISEGDLTQTAIAPGFALSGDDLYVTSEQTIKRVDWRTRQSRGESLPLPGDGEFFSMPDLVVAGDTLFAKTSHLTRSGPGGNWGRFESTANHIVAFDTSGATIEERWRVPFEGGFSHNTLWLAYGVGDGVIVAHGMDGNVTVIGKTAASLQSAPRLSDAYPDVGRTFTLDLGAARAGIGAPPDRYRVDWGDGTATGWQREPLFQHQYTSAGTYEAIAWIGNGDGQSTAVPVLVYPGLPPPEGSTFLSRAFERDNQDATFFVLGLLVTLIGAFIGVLRYRRRHRFLARELQAVTDGVARVSHHPESAESFLHGRRRHGTDLFTAGRLTADEHNVLQRHIQEHTAQLRLEDIDRHLPFLPYAIVREMRQALKDGRLQAAEEEHLVALVEHSEWLTAKQKKATKKVLQDWATHDAARG